MCVISFHSLAQQNKNPAENVSELLHFLQIVDAKHITASGSVLNNGDFNIKHIQMAWAPVVEPSGTINPFFDKSPSQLLNEIGDTDSKVDMLIGTASGESYLFIDPELRNTSLLNEHNELLEIALPLYPLNLNLDFDSDAYRTISEQIRTFYFGKNGQINKTTILEYSQLISDVGFSYGIDRCARIHGTASAGNIFFYKFSVEGKLNFAKLLTNARRFHLPGATHADEFFYSFRPGIVAADLVYRSLLPWSMERRMINHLTSLFTNFVVRGNPMPDKQPIHFQPVHANQFNYVDIVNNGFQAGINPFDARSQFWDELVGRILNK